MDEPSGSWIVLQLRGHLQTLMQSDVAAHLGKQARMEYISENNDLID